MQLSHVLYQNIRGTSASEVAIKFDCSRTVPCREIYLQDVILEPQGKGGGTTATCENVRYVNRGKFYPQCSPWRKEREGCVRYFNIQQYYLVPRFVMKMQHRKRGMYDYVSYMDETSCKKLF